MDLSDVVAALDCLRATAFVGTTYRHVAAGRPPISGEGARLVGGRWNPLEYVSYWRCSSCTWSALSRGISCIDRGDHRKTLPF